MAEGWALAVVGDFGYGQSDESEVAAAIEAWVGAHPNTAALVTSGDNFYTGDVEAAWSEPYGWVAGRGLAVWPVPGNHDIESAGQWQASVFAFGGFPIWRTETVGSLTLVLLDSNQIESTQQLAWLEATVAGLGSRPWIAVFHHPWRSCGPHGSAVAVEARWGGPLSGARLVLNGHDHNYQRFETERGWSIVTGGGGRSVYAVGECPPGTSPPVAAVEAFHFLGIVGDGAGFTVEAIGVDGRVFDSVRVDY